jgi:hypothetical protein
MDIGVGKMRLKHGVKSYQVVKRIFDMLGVKDAFVIDLTYGTGRFWRLVRRRISFLVGVDIQRLNWEVKPDIFYLTDSRWFSTFYNPPRKPTLIAVDPPWSSEKRGSPPQYTGVTNRPYHLRVQSFDLVIAALRLSKRLEAPILYRFKEKLPYPHILHLEVEVTMMGNRGIVHYGVINP